MDLPRPVTTDQEYLAAILETLKRIEEAIKPTTKLEKSEKQEKPVAQAKQGQPRKGGNR